jgi:exonuclease III
LSINVQSLQSKHENLCIELNELQKNNISVDVIALQEIWDIRYPELVAIDGFKPLIFKKRRGMRGGGVGFYVKNSLCAEILENFSPFENKIIETLTIQLTYPSSNQRILLTSVYRSNGPIINVTASQQMDSFIEKFSNLLTDLKATNKPSFVFTDSNINLLNLQTVDTANYLNTILANGYLQCVSKASRIQNDGFSLLDHVLSNRTNNNVYAGTLVSDVSDHFFTFIMPKSSLKSNQQIHKTIVSRDFSQQNLDRFKLELSIANWDNVLAQRDVDPAYDEFWTIYLEIYNRTFELKRRRFNKNINKRQNFITRGILVSRNTKQNLFKKSISSPSVENIAKYKNFKTIYQRVIRAAKKLYFTSKLESNADNPKKTWETLNEILGKNRGSVNIDSVNINGNSCSEPVEIANHFNTFFTAVGQQISDSVPPVEKKAEDYINYNRPVPDLLLQNTTPEHIIKTVKNFKPKNSSDAQGVSTKMIKHIGNEIAVPLAHIFNLSLSTGVFPWKTKAL